MGLVIQAPVDPVIASPAPAHPDGAGDASKAPNGFAAIVNSLVGDARGTAKKDARESILGALKQALPADEDAPGGAAKAPNGFAALVNALLGDATGTAKKDARDSLLDVLKQATPAQDGGATSGADAVAAALAAMQALLPAVLAANSGSTAAGESVQALAAAAPGATFPVAVADVATAAQTGPSADIVASAPSVPAEDAAPLAQALDPTSAPTTPEAAPSAAAVQQQTDVSITPSANLSAAAAVAEAQGIVSGKTADSETRPNESRKRDAVDPAASSPGDPAPPALQDATSVVRFVGNAQSSQGNAENGGSPDHKNEPNASVQGIAHAAANSAVGYGGDNASDVAPTDVPPSTPATPADLPPAVQRISQTVIEQIAKGGGEARIHLHPAELGEVVVRVSTDGDHVRVEIHAARAEAMNLLRDHTADLSNLLGGRGLHLADVFVGLGGQAASDGRDQQSATTPNRPLDSEFAALMGIDESPATDLHNRLRAAYNPDGALSYRI